MLSIKAIYAIPGIAGRFIFYVSKRSDIACWEAEVNSLPGMPVIGIPYAPPAELALELIHTGNYRVSPDLLPLAGTPYDLLEQSLINYCRAYARYLETGLPVNTFL